MKRKKQIPIEKTRQSARGEEERLGCFVLFEPEFAEDVALVFLFGIGELAPAASKLADSISIVKNKTSLVFERLWL